jgi:hypothetical protein
MAAQLLNPDRTKRRARNAKREQSVHANDPYYIAGRFCNRESVDQIWGNTKNCPT